MTTNNPECRPSPVPNKSNGVCLSLGLFTLISYVVLTTSGGIMDHEEARRKHLGGKILGFFF